MTVVVAFLVGLVTVRFLLMVSGEILASPALERTNYHGQRLATAGGIFIILTVLVIDSGRSVLGAIGVGSESGLTQARLVVLVAVFGFGFLGLLDDLPPAGTTVASAGTSARCARDGSRPASSSCSVAPRWRSWSSPPRASSRAAAHRRRRADRTGRQPRQPARSPARDARSRSASSRTCRSPSRSATRPSASRWRR